MNYVDGFISHEEEKGSTTEQDCIAKLIYDNFLMKLLRLKRKCSYWLIDTKDNNDTPAVIVEKHGELFNRWRAYIEDREVLLCENHRTRKSCVAMAEFKLANYLAQCTTAKKHQLLSSGSCDALDNRQEQY
jgi:hypothetical protein